MTAEETAAAIDAILYSDHSIMTPAAFKWVLFTALSLSAPLLFFIGMAGGYFPLVGIATISLFSLISDPLLAIFGLVNIAIYSSLFFGIALVAAKLSGHLSARLRLALALGVVVVLAAGTLQPWYGWGGYATSRYYPLHILVQRALHPERA